jgi:hypothetical protein
MIKTSRGASALKGSGKSKHALVISTPYTLKLIEDTVVLIQVAKFPAEVIMDGNGLHRARLHVDVPDLEGEIVARQDIPPIVTELDIRYRRYDLREERAGCWILLFLEACT